MLLMGMNIFFIKYIYISIYKNKFVYSFLFSMYYIDNCIYPQSELDSLDDNISRSPNASSLPGEALFWIKDSLYDQKQWFKDKMP